MLEIIPALEIIEGLCVKFNQGSYNLRTVSSADPFEIAVQLEGLGFRRLHMIDADGLRQGRVVSYRILDKICSKTRLRVDLKSGYGSMKDFDIALENGARSFSVSVENAAQIKLLQASLDRFGAEQVILDLHAKELAIEGEAGLSLTGILSPYLQREIPLVHLSISCRELAGETQSALDFDCYRRLADELPDLKVRAGEGVKTLADIEELETAHVASVIVGRALCEGTITLAELGALSL